MTNNAHGILLSHPAVLWTDLGLRALDMTLSSSHNICDGVDRLTRAAAVDRAIIKGAARSSAEPADSAGAAAPLGMAAATAILSRSGFDLLTQGWLQWMTTFGTVLCSAPAGPDRDAPIPWAGGRGQQAAADKPVMRVDSEISLRKRRRQPAENRSPEHTLGGAPCDDLAKG